MKKVRTARGDVVDFQELKIRQQLGSVPPTLDVQARDVFVDQRLRRRSRKRATELAQQVAQDSVDDQVVDQEQDDIELPEVEEAPAQPEKVRMKRGG